MLTANWKQTLAAVGLTLTLSGAGAALTGGAIGLAQAQADPTPSTTHRGAHEGRHAPQIYAVAAQAIGITPQQLQQELPGKSLAQVAAAHGKSSADVASALKQAVSQRIDRAMNRVVSANVTGP
jgi:hypothetical protein